MKLSITFLLLSHFFFKYYPHLKVHQVTEIIIIVVLKGLQCKWKYPLIIMSVIGWHKALVKIYNISLRTIHMCDIIIKHVYGHNLIQIIKIDNEICSQEHKCNHGSHAVVFGRERGRTFMIYPGVKSVQRLVVLHQVYQFRTFQTAGRLCL